MLPLSLNRLVTEDIFSLLGLQELPDAEKETLLASMEQTVLARVYGAICDELESNELNELDGLHGEPLMQYFANKGFDIPQMMVDESVRYRMELATTFQLMTTPDTEPAAA